MPSACLDSLVTAQVVIALYVGLFGEISTMRVFGDFLIGSAGSGSNNVEELNLFNQFVSIVIIVIIFFITVLPLNMLVGVLSNSYERHFERAQELFVRERALRISSLRTRPWVRPPPDEWVKIHKDEFVSPSSLTAPSPAPSKVRAPLFIR